MVIITGTHGEPIEVVGEIHALPALVITRMPSSTKSSPSGTTTFLKNGTVSEEDTPALPTRMTAQAGNAGDDDLGQQPQLAGDAGGLGRR